MKKVVLNNGLTVIARSFSSEYVSLHIDVGVGTYHESQGVLGYNNGDIVGATHFIEHVVFGDTRRHSSEEIARLDALCKEANAQEGVMNTDYWVQGFSPINLELILNVMTSILFGAMFKTDDVEIERNIIISEMRIAHDNITNTDESNCLVDSALKALYDKHPFRLPVLGTEETVRNLGRTVLFGLYQKYYVPNKMIVSVVGGIDEEDSIDAVKRHFGRYPIGEIPKLQPVFEPERTQPIEIPFESRDVQQHYLMLGIRAIPQLHPGSYTLEVIDDILGGGCYSRLFRDIRRKHGLAYSPNTKYSCVSDEGYFRVDSQAPPTREGLEDVKRIILDNLDRLAKEPVTQDELELSKSALVESHKRASVDIEVLAEDLCFFERVGIGIEAYDSYPDKIFAVTSADIKEFAKNYLNTQGYVLVGVKPREPIIS
jgi:predicted Zn-dependent peptidase